MSVALRFVLLCYFISVTYARTEEEIHSWFISLAMECNKDHEITLDEMTQLHSHKVPDSENAKCLLACIYKKSTWFDNKGMFDVASVNSFAEKEHIGNEDIIEKSKKLFDICKTVNDATVTDGEKGCQRAALLTTCLTGNAPKSRLYEYMRQHIPIDFNFKFTWASNS